MSCDKRRDIVDNSFPDLERYVKVYKDFHQSPELSLRETKTASIVATLLEENSFIVQDDFAGSGVIGTFFNGPGETVLLRAELDALPIKEETGLPYASKVKQIDVDGIMKGVMHACAHDMHMTCLLGVAELLTSSWQEWSGTVVVLFQPNAEPLGGVMDMLASVLFRKIPYPNICLAQHCVPIKSGTIAVKPGRVLGCLDSLDVRVYGRGTHVATSQLGVDPVPLAASIIARLQTIVACEMDPKEHVVIRSGEFRSGTDVSIIPDYADFKVDVRSFSEDTQKLAIAAIKKFIRKECVVFGSPIPARILTTLSCPGTDNDEEATGRFIQTLKDYYGDKASEVVQEMSPDIVADDFPLLALESDQEPMPYIYWNIGSTDPQLWDEAKREGRLHGLPSLHTAQYAPAIEPTLRTGIEALALAALTFLTLK